MSKIKYCKFCDKEKPEEDFCKSGGYIKNICRDCQNKKQKQIYQDSKRTKQLEQEIERLNNIINELEKKLLELRLTDVDGKTIVYRLLDKLQELKGSDK